MTQNQTGYLVAIAGLGMMLGLMAIEISNIGEWQQVKTPIFVGKTMAHFATVIAAFVGGKLIKSE